ncbi:MAG: hypothetical protein KDD42_03295, partial [Bdellovibrionales bacterium]|nr:hypothetical protein [Bdellovibrionales bacterium]
INNERVLSLTGLTGIGSIPMLAFCAGGLISYAVAVAAQFLLIVTAVEKEAPMKTTQNKTSLKTSFVKANLHTIAAVSAGVGTGYLLG